MTQELDARGAALSEKIEALLAQAPATAVRVKEEAAAPAEPLQGGSRTTAIPELQRVAVCGVDGGEGLGQRLHALLRGAARSPIDEPRWVDLEQASAMNFEALDALLAGTRALVVCPDLEDERRRTVEGVRMGLKVVVASLPTNVSRVVLLSRIGSQAMKGGINMRSFFGLGYGSTLTGIEDELTSAARRRSRREPLNVVIVRVGSLRETGTAAKLVRCLPGDSDCSGSTSPDTAVEALVQVLVQRLDANVCVVDEPSSSAKANWRELLLPFIGPEVWRVEVRSATRAAIFVQSWAEEWFGSKNKSASAKDTLRWGVKTPLQLQETPTGVVFKFRPLGTPSARTFEDLQDGGLEFVAEQPAQGAPRLRVTRCSYGWKVIVKENSERAILNKFKEDWAVAGG